MRAPPDKPGRWPEQPAPRTTTLTADETSKVSHSVPDSSDGVVVELAERRARRLLADLNLAPTVEAPCSGCCRCHGWPEGLECQP